jgi:excinuclease UvrABC nuclease subunit
MKEVEDLDYFVTRNEREALVLRISSSRKTQQHKAQGR